MRVCKYTLIKRLGYAFDILIFFSKYDDLPLLKENLLRCANNSSHESSDRLPVHKF